MLAKPNLFLVGPMGSGKSAVGKQLSRLLRRPFYDCDAEIERRTGVDIPYIFEKEGEAGFRQRENETLEILTTMDRIVMATGGGAILLPENRRILAERGRVVYLKTSVAQQVRASPAGSDPAAAQQRRPLGQAAGAHGNQGSSVHRNRGHHRPNR